MSIIFKNKIFPIRWTRRGQCTLEPNGPQKRKGEFTLENFAGAFCVLAAGLVIASLVAVIEIWSFVKGGNVYPPVSHRVENETKGSSNNLAKADMFIQVIFVLAKFKIVCRQS